MALSAELLGDGQYEGSTIAGVVGRRLLFIDAGAFFGMNLPCVPKSLAPRSSQIQRKHARFSLTHPSSFLFR